MSTKTSPANDSRGRWGCAVLIALIFCLEAQAQPVSKVVIAIDPLCSGDVPKEIIVVLTVGKQTVSFGAERDDTDGFWKGKYLDREHPKIKTFPANRATASLRLKDFRTDCEPSIASESDAKEDIATFTFQCDRQEVRGVAIQTDGPINLEYLRRNASAHCRNELERETLTANTPQNVPDIWVPGEEFRLLINRKKVGPPDTGLLVFSLDPKHRDLPVFWSDPGNSRRLLYLDERNRPRELKSRVSLPLSLDYVVNLLAKQRSVINGNNSKNSRINDDERLRGKLRTLTLTVN